MRHPKFQKGTLVTIIPPPAYTPGGPEIVAVWNEPPHSKGTKVVNLLNKNDIILITDTWNLDKQIQYSKVYCSHSGTSGWVNSKFLKLIQD